MKYIYAIVKKQKTSRLPGAGLKSKAIKGKGTESVDGIHVTAITSEVGEKNIPLKKEHILAHDKVLEEALEVYDAVLPVGFGTIVAENELRDRLLRPRDKELLKMLKDVKGKVEVDVKGFWADFKGMVRELREKDPVISSLELPEDLSYQEVVSIGKALEDALDQRRESYRKGIMAGSKVCKNEIKENPLIAERMVFNLAFLIPAGCENRLKKHVQDFSKENEDLVVWYSGPVVPSNFVSWREQS